MTRELEDLLQRIGEATGADAALDRLIAERLERSDPSEAVPDYTASVDSCLALIARVLPGWAWHIGFGPRGIFPYATLHDDRDRCEALAPTVPLALLQAAVQARRALALRGESPGESHAQPSGGG